MPTNDSDSGEQTKKRPEESQHASQKPTPPQEATRPGETSVAQGPAYGVEGPPSSGGSPETPSEARPISRLHGERPPGIRKPRGTAAMDPQTRQEVARKGGLAVSRNRQHMAEIGKKGGQSVSKNRDHMAEIGRKGGEASRGHR